MATMVCPICGMGAGESKPRLGEFDAFDCPTHGAFEVSDTAMAARPGKASPSEWERALDRAKLRGEPARIMDEDFA